MEEDRGCADGSRATGRHPFVRPIPTRTRQLFSRPRNAVRKAVRSARSELVWHCSEVVAVHSAGFPQTLAGAEQDLDRNVPDGSRHFGDEPVSGPTRARIALSVKLLAARPIVRLRCGIGVLAIGFAHPGVLDPSSASFTARLINSARCRLAAGAIWFSAL
jgi:hypothetical protein